MNKLKAMGKVNSKNRRGVVVWRAEGGVVVQSTAKVFIKTMIGIGWDGDM